MVRVGKGHLCLQCALAVWQGFPGLIFPGSQSSCPREDRSAHLQVRVHTLMQG